MHRAHGAVAMKRAMAARKNWKRNAREKSPTVSDNGIDKIERNDSYSEFRSASDVRAFKTRAESLNGSVLVTSDQPRGDRHCLTVRMTLPWHGGRDGGEVAGGSEMHAISATRYCNTAINCCVACARAKEFSFVGPFIFFYLRVPRAKSVRLRRASIPHQRNLEILRVSANRLITHPPRRVFRLEIAQSRDAPIFACSIVSCVLSISLTHFENVQAAATRNENSRRRDLAARVSCETKRGGGGNKIKFRIEERKERPGEGNTL